MKFRIVVQDRIVNAAKNLKKTGSAAAMALLPIILPLAIQAQEETGINTFEDGNIIYAQDMNENFENLDGRLGTYESAIHVDSETGSVGVGTALPVLKLDVASELSTDSDGINIIQVADAQTPVLALNRARGTIASPTAIDQVRGVGAISFSGYDGTSYQTGAQIYIASDGAFSSSDWSSNIRLLTTSGTTLSERMRITSGGNVGIGTSSPEERLHVRTGNIMADSQDSLQSANLILRSAWSQKVALLLDIDTSVNSNEWAIFPRMEGATDTLYIGTNISHDHNPDLKTKVLALTESGHLGIGTSNPSAYHGYGDNLVIHGSEDQVGITIAGDPGSHQGTIFFADGTEGDETQRGMINYSHSDDSLYFYTAAQFQMVLDDGGNVGIGTTNPAYALDVVGQIRADNVQVNSDIRLKTDIIPLINALERVLCLEGVSYRWAAPSASQDLQLGLIAQEVESCFPEVVSTDAQGYKSVAYGRLVAPIVEAVKEQQSIIENHEQTIRKLRKQLEDQETGILELRESLRVQQREMDSLRALLTKTALEVRAKGSKTDQVDQGRR